MELYLQFGFGMMEHSLHLLSSWGGGTVILSPRDLEPVQVQSFGSKVLKLKNGHILFDPQFYLPHADHARLTKHDYWPQQYDTGIFWSGSGLEDLITKLANLNRTIGCRRFILPGLLAETINDDWLNQQQAVLDTAAKIASGFPLLVTLALSADAVRNQDQIHELLDTAADWNSEGFYVVCEHPNGKYLVDDPSWITNVLDLLSGLRLRGKEVILGYCTHQFLIASLSKASAIASGTWMNLRSFPPEKFSAAYNEDIKQKAVWYYCPQALSEYKIPSLDLAYSQGLLAAMAPPPNLGSNYAMGLFGGTQPTTVGLDEPNAFRHYLQSFHSQVGMLTSPSFDEAVAAEEQRLDTARQLLNQLQRAGVLGQLRDFSPILDSNLAAIRAHFNTRGHQMRRHWNSL
jgi:hypothetical protein